MPDLYGGNVVKPFLGRVVLKKLAGAGPISVGTQITLPHASAVPRNPLNTAFLTGISSSAYQSGDVAGKRTPSCTLTTVVKTSSYFTADFINSLILASDSNGDTDVWSILLDDLYSPDVYDGAKCAGFHLRQYAKGGPMALSLAFISMYGDSQNPGTAFTPTSFSSGSGDPGTITDVSKVSYGGSADLVSALTLDLVRPQTYVFYDDGTSFPAGVASGVLTGQMSITQSVKYSAAWSTSAAVNIGVTGAGVAISAHLSLKEELKEFKTESRMAVRTFQVYNSGGSSPISVTAL